LDGETIYADTSSNDTTDLAMTVTATSGSGSTIETGSIDNEYGSISATFTGAGIVNTDTLTADSITISDWSTGGSSTVTAIAATNAFTLTNSGTGAHTITTLGAGTAITVTHTGSAALNIGTISDGYDTLSIDASGASGAVVITTNSGSSTANNPNTITGGTGNDKLVGGASANTLTGNNGDDTLVGAASADVLSGGDGADTLFGAAGNDTLTTGEGADTVTGEAGNDSIDLTETTSAADVLVYTSAVGSSTESGASRVAGTDNDLGADTITGFTWGTDLIKIVATGVTAFNVDGTDVAVGTATGAANDGTIGSFSISWFDRHRQHNKCELD